MRGQILSVLFVLLVINGCAITFPGQGLTNRESTAEENPFQGTKGLELSFTDDTPSRTSAGDSIRIGLAAHNQGAKNIESYVVRLAGLSGLITLRGDNPLSSEEAIKGTQEADRGEIEYIRWNADIKSDISGLSSGGIEIPLHASVCYKSKMVLNIPVCIRPSDGSEYIVKNGCTLPSDDSISSGQGAPIEVYRITETPSGGDSGNTHKFKFEIKFRDGGNGKVVTPSGVDFTQKCAFTPTQLNEAKLTIENSRLVGGGNLKCKSKNANINELLMINGEGTLYCETEGSFTEEQHFPVNLYMTIDYGYMTDISKDITVKGEAVTFDD